MIYRKATGDDTSELSKMRWEFQTESNENKTIWTKEKFIEFCEVFYVNIIDSTNWLFWVAEDNDKIISHVSVHIINNIPSPNRLINKWGYLTNSYTKKEYRNQGVGSKLIEHAIKDVKSNDIETLIVWPSDKSFQFYKRTGFTENNCIMEFPID